MTKASTAALSSFKTLHRHPAPIALCRSKQIFAVRGLVASSTYTWRSQHYASSGAYLARTRNTPLYTSPSLKATTQLGLTSFPAPGQHSRYFSSARHSAQHSSSTRVSPLPGALKSSFQSWTAVVLVCAVAILYSVAPGSTILLNRHKVVQQPVPQVVQKPDNMTGEVLAGRPGTLTAEEEAKLKEFWVAALEVFGVIDKSSNGHATTPDSASVMSDKKPKKKRMSLFRRKDDPDASSETKQSEDDKYGQTKEFHDALANMSPETLRATFWSMVKMDHPDGLLLRFLRARKWDVEKALVMMVSTMRWRQTELHVDDDIMRNGELGALEDSNGSDPAKKKMGLDFLTQMRMGKSFLHGVDGSDRPMCFVRVRLHHGGEQSEESVERYTVFIIETARMTLAPPIDTACVVFDMTGFSMANMDYAPVKFMIKCFEANYPESLGVVLVHKAPWLFQGIWKIIRGWLDPVVASKIQFTSNNAEMEKFVPHSQITKELDGGEDWTYKYIEPVPGENDLMKDTGTRDKLLQGREIIVKDYEKATLEWIHGTGDSSALKVKRNEIANNLKDDYWKLDPYVRARSLYDRAGMINPGGKLQFYPSKGERVETPVAPINGAAKPVETSHDDID